MTDPRAESSQPRRRFQPLPAVLLGLALLMPGGGALADRPSCADSHIANDKHRPGAVPDTRYEVHGAVVTDQFTGLMWKRCSEGQQWNGSTCTGSVQEFEWQEAQERAEAVNNGEVGHNHQVHDWRVPTRVELASLATRYCEEPAINTTIFPNTAASGLGCYWSATTSANHSDFAWNAFFDYGNLSSGGGKLGDCGVRLVRGGQ